MKFIVFACRLLLPPVILAALAAQGGDISLEAENGTLTGVSVSSSTPGYSGTGYVTGFDNAGDNVRWSFAASNGLYDLRIRFRTPSGGKGFDATVNGFTTSGMFPSSSQFATQYVGLVQLTNGNNTLQVGGGWNWYEIDRVDFIGTNPAPPSPVSGLLVNTQATLAARMLMADLASDYGKMTWSGQQETNEIASVASASGRKPLIICGDLMDYSPSRIQYGANPGTYVENYIALESAGHVSALIWHWNAPTNLVNTQQQPWWSGFYTSATTFDVQAALLSTNSAEYGLLLRDIDAIAVQLKKFSSNNIPVLWRPLHEAEGGWFWWGAKGSGPFKQLWRLLYSRLTSYHGLNNLIWIYTPSATLSPDWYPGDDVVDIVGMDAYPSDRTDPLSGTWQTLLSQFDGNKMLALTEFGGVPDIEKMQLYGVWWSWFSPWVGANGPSSTNAAMLARIYQSAGVLTLEEANAVSPRILSIALDENSHIQLVGKGPRGQTNRVFTAGNVSVPVGAWTGVYTGKFSGGVFTWTDPNLTSNTSRYYRVRSN